MNHPVIQFVRRGEIVSLRDVPPTRTLLQVLREDLHCTGTKEGCNEGDCGACTVVLGEAQGKGENQRIHYSAVNSCIRLAHSVHGLALWTAEDLAATDGTLHPAQQAMVNCHASQCGFCTPGFVMSLFGLYQNHVAQGDTVTRELAQQALSGNLCRCTGYRPILDAAQHMAQLPTVQLDESDLLQKLELLAQEGRGLEANSSYISPNTLPALLAARAAHPDAQLVAGCTDVGLWINKLHKQFAKVLDVTRVPALRNIEDYPHHIAIGAALTLTDAFSALVADRPQLHTFATRFAGLPVRNSGTLGGNVANGSPIGDSMPLLIALGAHVVLMSERGHRAMPLEQFYTGYRQNQLAADEVLAWIKVPKATPGELLRVYKISKRFDDDISAVCLAIKLHLAEGNVAQASIGVGGVAATPVRALQTEAALLGQAWTLDTVQQAISTLRGEFAPISDMRASASYRVQVLGNLLQRFWLESQGMEQINLDAFTLAGENT
ncbi:MAG: xanthine dehydrogenase small subunit [Rhodoferax sp.]|uniref:xanthine dehydrogenase small subunit n=1 Tax=Rhodoferax sp. TaxID=50421 RepID=UPI0017B716B5|nr:xanthine dehydrogenase small subunit [Rhodoferax sp.]NMM19987.1 xanthine dehydrogenase small subunit [Rhodoferax sp.]